MDFELATNGTLEDAMKAHKFKSGVQQRKLVIDCCRGLNYIHSKCQLLHNDVKPENILAFSNMYKITDYGLASEIDLNEVEAELGTFQYVAQEFFDSPAKCTDYDDAGRLDIFGPRQAIFKVLVGSLACPIPEKIGKVWDDLV